MVTDQLIRVIDPVTIPRMEKADMVLSTKGCCVLRSYQQIVISNFTGLFPNEVTVQSHKTGREVKCDFNIDGALKSKSWDGLMAEYIPRESIPGFAKLILTH